MERSRQQRRPDVTSVEIVGGAERLDVELHAHDETWADAFLDHRRRIRGALADAAIEIEHIGSTSVAGLAAKPIIDIVVVVDDITAEEEYLDRLLSVGYVLRVREPGHRLVRTPERDVHVHLYERDDPAVEAYLVLRDHLRCDADDRALYANVKKALLEKQWDDMNDYADAKTDVIAAIMARARAIRAAATTHPLWLPFAAEANAMRQGQRIADRQTPPGPIQEYDANWRDDFLAVERLIAGAIGERAIEIRHVGSTAVPGLSAKPVIDIDLTVRDVEDEGAYLPRLEAAGFRLIFRDAMASDPHRHLTLARPNTNLHVWSPGALEPRRHALFTAWLGTNASDRERYSAAKAIAADATGGERYNDRKAAVVYDIYERAFFADPLHHHDPRPRAVSGAS